MVYLRTTIDALELLTEHGAKPADHPDVETALGYASSRTEALLNALERTGCVKFNYGGVDRHLTGWILTP